MRVGVIMGGTSSERDISLLTGQEMVANLDRSKYEVIPIELNSKRDLIDKSEGIDVALLALHGKYGEDGTVQGTLESLGIPYTGCGVLASSVCMDKDMSKQLMRQAGVLTGDWLQVKQMQDLSSAAVQQLTYPVVVKPNSGGSSIGTQIVHEPSALAAAVGAALAWDDSVMIEQYIEGDEITCAIVDGKMLPVISIRANAAFFDYAAKYDDNGADEQVIQLPHDLHQRVEAAALTCYTVLKCSVYARVDMLIRDGVPYVLEVNTLPGLTRNSLLPKSAAAAGISFAELLDTIIDLSLNERSVEVSRV
ncbi:D-alanine--D-alanine ligase [Paenibacillus silvae]|uniref:D-alanine--D-alanine ligase n=1 Tax=Paenibacillus silvae TaxID=1325358 RepID=UPI0020044416|nr:D-alanine--D-alanine ligase [Paenibacillus silvae]MCK6078822.1 D-alanine--D-alanine ligase [Paenibacillus silvae]MCK6153141.1 D-alanine--D-alanine ligase [Paenibacillus silvae]MCK6271652.1 D-alanine--D-alanine ligase [Paenibacillus silvae]